MTDHGVDQLLLRPCPPREEVAVECGTAVPPIRNATVCLAEEADKPIAIQLLPMLLDRGSRCGRLRSGGRASGAREGCGRVRDAPNAVQGAFCQGVVVGSRGCG